MTREQMRRDLLDGIDRLLGLSRLFVGREQRRVLRATRLVYEHDDQVVDKVCAAYATVQAEPQTDGEGEAPCDARD